MAVVLNKRRWRRNVAGLHRGHAGSSGHRWWLTVQVQHSVGKKKTQSSTRSETKERTRKNWAQTRWNKTVQLIRLNTFWFGSLPFGCRWRHRGQWGTHPFRRRFVILLVFWGAVQCQINHINFLVVVLSWSSV